MNHKPLVAALFFVALFCFSASAFSPKDFGFVRQVTINSNASVTLQDFPAFVKLDTTSMIADGKLNDNCSDLAITLDGVTALDKEMESCNTNESILWFRVPSFPQGDLTASLYYGSSTDNESENASGVFRNGYYLVNHMASTGGASSVGVGMACFYDSLAESPLGYGLRYDNPDDYNTPLCRIQNVDGGASTDFLRTWNFSVSMLYEPKYDVGSLPDGAVLFSKRNARVSDVNSFALYYAYTANPPFVHTINARNDIDGVYANINSQQDIGWNSNEFRRVGAQTNGSISIYQNGSDVTDYSSLDAYPSGNSSLIGYDTTSNYVMSFGTDTFEGSAGMGGGVQLAEGVYDELRISVPRSPAWTQAEAQQTQSLGGESPTKLLTTQLTSPRNASSLKNNFVAFRANASSINNSIENATLYTNASGSWLPFVTLQGNDTFFSYDTTEQSGTYDFNVQFCTAIECEFAPDNFTYTVEPQESKVTLVNPNDLATVSSLPIVFQANSSISNNTNTHGANLTDEFDWYQMGGVEITATRNSTLVSVGVAPQLASIDLLSVYVFWDNQTEITNSSVDMVSRAAAFNLSLEEGQTYLLAVARSPPLLEVYDFHQVQTNALNNPAEYPYYGRDFDYVAGVFGDYGGLVPYPNYLWDIANITTNIPVVNSTLYSNLSGSWQPMYTQASDNDSFYHEVTGDYGSAAYGWNALFCTSADCAFANDNFSFLYLSPSVHVALLSPDNASNQSGSVTFNAFITGRNITNATLWGEFNGTWCENSTVFTNDYASYRVFLPNGNYTWNVQACGNDGCAFAPENFTFNVTGVTPISAEENSDGFVLWFVLAALFFLSLAGLYADKANWLIRWFFYALATVFLIYGFFVLVAFTQASPVDNVIFTSMLDIFSVVMSVLPWFAFIGACIVGYDLSVKWLEQHKKVIR